jgi:hypothetical protein
MAKKLTITQLRFIDKYLKSSGVRYDDIRCELTDHVATALENMDGDFETDFKLYMINNKVDIKNSNRNSKKLAWRRAFHILNKNLVSYTVFIITLIIFLPSYIAASYLNKEDIVNNLHFVMQLTSSVVFFYFLYYKVFSKSNHSVIDRLLTIVYFGAVILRTDRLIHSNNVLLFYYSFVIAFFIMLIESLWKLRKRYKLQYHG